MMTRPTLLLASILLLPSIGCDLESTLDIDRASVWLDDESGPEGAEHRREPPPVRLLQTALRVGELDEEPAMDEALSDREAADLAARAAHEAFRASLADAVASRSVDAGAFEPAVSQWVQLAAEQGRALEHAIDTAHSLLDEAERADVVDMLPPPPPAGGHPPQPGEGDRSQRGGPGRGDPGHGPGALLGALELDDSQHQALRDALGEPPRPERPSPPDLRAFADDSFSAASLGVVEHHQTHVRHRAEHEVQLLAALVPLLDDAQLATLEELLRTAPGPERAPV